MSNRHEHLDWRAVALLVVLSISWGLQQISIKVAIDDISPIWQAAIRSMIAGGLLWGWMAFRRTPILERDGTLWAGIGAGLLFGGEFLVLYWGLSFTTASRAVVFLYLAPFVVAIGAHLFIPNEPLKRLHVIGLALAFSGIVLAFGNPFAAASGETFVGDVMLIVAAVLWGATTVLIKASALATIRPSKTLLYQLGISAAVLPLGALALDAPWTGTLTPVAVMALAYQGVWVAFVTYLAWFWLIRHYPAAKLSAFSFLTPMFGVLGGGVLLDEAITPQLLGALGLVAAGIYLVNKR